MVSLRYNIPHQSGIVCIVDEDHPGTDSHAWVMIIALYARALRAKMIINCVLKLLIYLDVSNTCTKVF